MSKRNQLNAENLKNVLWDTLNLVKNKKIDPKQANAVASLSRETMRVVRTEIQVVSMGIRGLAPFSDAVPQARPAKQVEGKKRASAKRSK